MQTTSVHSARFQLYRTVAGWSWVLLCLSLEQFSANAEKPMQAQVLTNVQQVRRMSLAEARQQHPVRLRGVVTFHQATNFVTYLQDDTAGIHVKGWDQQRSVTGLKAGQFVEVEGVTSVGLFSPIVVGVDNGPAKFHILDQGSFPQPIPLSSDPFSQIPQHCQWVEVPGLVRTVYSEGAFSVIEIQTLPGRIRLHTSGADYPLDKLTHLVAAKISVQGVFSVEPNFKMQSAGMNLLVPSLDFVRIERVSAADPFSLPVRPVENLLRFNLNEGGGRIRLQGTVTLQVPRIGFFIQDQLDGIWIQSRQAENLLPGERVDVVGFPGVGEGYAILEDAVFRHLDRGPPPKPDRLAASQVIAGGHHSELVSVEAVLIEHLPGVDEHLLVMQSGDVTVHALLPAGLARRAWTDLQPDNRYLATGVALLRAKEVSLFRAKEQRNVKADLPLTFKLRLRDSADLVLLQAGPWLTLERIIWLLAMSLTLLLTVFSWVLLLRRQIRKQTSVIRQQLDEQAILDERARIARELHDSLGQDMAGVSIQLDTTAARLDRGQPGDAFASLNLAREMMRHAQAEARRSVWNLRACELENHDLPSAMCSTLVPAASAGLKPAIQVQVVGEPERLSGLWENHLLRIAQEAVTNAGHHGQAEKILVELIYDENLVILQVTDNGIGFDSEHSTALASGHFGLLGIRERTEKMNGRLSVKSSPGKGTCVRVEVGLSQCESAPRRQRAASNGND